MVRMHDEELGGIRYTWVYLEGRPGVNVGRAPIPEEEATRNAETYWMRRDREEEVASNLREEYNKQVYIGSLPTHDIVWDGPPGWYAYVLKDRKSHGRYVILEAVEL